MAKDKDKNAIPKCPPKCPRCGGSGVTMVETRLGPRIGKCPACR